MQFAETIKLLRPKQWLKNFFVLAPLIFSKGLFSSSSDLAAIKGFVIFCLVASSVYIINDIRDVEADRAHPLKRKRPIAAGTISPANALIIVVLLLALSSIVAIGMDEKFLLVIGTYLGLNIAYSLKLKEVVLLDVFIIAAGFMMRVLAGAYAIQVEVSSWIVLCTMFIALFLGFAKRRGEIMMLGKQRGENERKVLSDYQVAFIDQMLTIAAAGTVISYALYTVSARTLEVLGTDKMIYTTVFVLYGIFRYLHLVHTGVTTENPTGALTSDSAIVVTGILWILACVTLIYIR